MHLVTAPDGHVEIASPMFSGAITADAAREGAHELLRLADRADVLNEKHATESAAQLRMEADDQRELNI